MFINSIMIEEKSKYCWSYEVFILFIWATSWENLFMPYMSDQRLLLFAYGINRFSHDMAHDTVFIYSYFCCTYISMGDLGVQVSVRLSIRSSVCSAICPSVNIYPGCLVSATPLTVLYRLSWNFAGVFVMVWGCACGLDIVVRLFFVTFSTLWT